MLGPADEPRAPRSSRTEGSTRTAYQHPDTHGPALTRTLRLFAKADLSAGVELSYNYSVKFVGDVECAQRCYCGAPNCTGYLGRLPRSARVGSE